MKKIIQVLLIIILTAIIALMVIVIFNPADLRTKLISSMLNSYLTRNLDGYTPSASPSTGGVIDKHPLLDAEQEKTLESFGVDVEALPTEITPAMQDCFTEKLGQERILEIINGATPGALDFIKAGGCLGG